MAYGKIKMGKGPRKSDSLDEFVLGEKRKKPTPPKPPKPNIIRPTTPKPLPPKPVPPKARGGSR
jgi:hypothetical protein